MAMRHSEVYEIASSATNTITHNQMRNYCLMVSGVGTGNGESVKTSNSQETAHIAARSALIYDRHTAEHSKEQRKYSAIAEQCKNNSECKVVFDARVTGSLEALLTMETGISKRQIRQENRRGDYHSIVTCQTTPLPINNTLSGNEIMLLNLQDKYNHRAYHIETDEEKVKFYKFMSRLATDAIMYVKGSALVLGLDEHVDFIEEEETARNEDKRLLCEKLNGAKNSAERQSIVDEYGAKVMKQRSLVLEHIDSVRQKNTRYFVEVDIFTRPFGNEHEPFSRKIFDTMQAAIDYAEDIAWNIGQRLKSAIVKKVFHGETVIIRSYDDTFILP